MAYLNLRLIRDPGLIPRCAVYRGTRSSRLTWAGVFVGVVVGCYSAPLSVNVLAPPVDRLNNSNASLADLEAGREIYLSSKKCAHCHAPKPVYAFARKEWGYAIIPKMSKKAELTREETDQVLAYVEAASTVSPPKTK